MSSTEGLRAAVIDIQSELLAAQARYLGMAYAKEWSSFNRAWYDHRLDWLLGPEWWMWAERGVFGARYIREGDVVLDLCCGDGLYAGCYYGDVAQAVDGVDSDPEAIEHANRLYERENVHFYCRDAVSDDFPRQKYDFVVFFGAIEHFSAQNGKDLLKKVKKCVEDAENGLFLGSTPMLDERWSTSPNIQHDNEFFALAGLFAFLEPHFEVLELWTSKWGLDRQRIEAYFLCGPRRQVSRDELLAKMQKLIPGGFIEEDDGSLRIDTPDRMRWWLDGGPQLSWRA